MTLLEKMIKMHVWNVEKKNGCCVKTGTVESANTASVSNINDNTIKRYAQYIAKQFSWKLKNIAVRYYEIIQSYAVFLEL